MRSGYQRGRTIVEREGTVGIPKRRYGALTHKSERIVSCTAARRAAGFRGAAEYRRRSLASLRDDMVNASGNNDLSFPNERSEEGSWAGFRRAAGYHRRSLASLRDDMVNASGDNDVSSRTSEARRDLGLVSGERPNATADPSPSAPELSRQDKQNQGPRRTAM